MSLQYINPEPRHQEIRERLLEILPLAYQGDNEQFFTLLDHLNCMINVFFTTKTFSTTDCCRTVDSIWELFSQDDGNYYRVKTIGELDAILYNSYNIFKFEVTGEFPFHTFILVHHDQNWYLLQSYTNLCGLTVTKDNRLPVLLRELLQTGSAGLYNLLFGTSLPEQTRAVSYGITVGRYQRLPLEELVALMLGYVER